MEEWGGGNKKGKSASIRRSQHQYAANKGWGPRTDSELHTPTHRKSNISHQTRAKNQQLRAQSGKQQRRAAKAEASRNRNK